MTLLKIQGWIQHDLVVGGGGGGGGVGGGGGGGGGGALKYKVIIFVSLGARNIHLDFYMLPLFIIQLSATAVTNWLINSASFLFSSLKFFYNTGSEQLANIGD
jgi:hypothetical protein